MKRPVGLLLLCSSLLTGVAFSASPSVSSSAWRGADRGEQKVSDEGARQQSDPFGSEKASRTPAQRKLDTQLLYALKQKRGETRGVPTLPIELECDAKGRVIVDITANVTQRVLSKIRRLGGSVISKFENYHAIRASLPLEKLEALAALEDVRYIMPAAEAMTQGGAVHD